MESANGAILPLKGRMTQGASSVSSFLHYRRPRCVRRIEVNLQAACTEIGVRIESLTHQQRRNLAALQEGKGVCILAPY